MSLRLVAELVTVTVHLRPFRVLATVAPPLRAGEA